MALFEEWNRGEIGNESTEMLDNNRNFCVFGLIHLLCFGHDLGIVEVIASSAGDLLNHDKFCGYFREEKEGRYHWFLERQNFARDD